MMMYKIKKALDNISKVENVKLENCDIYKEYSVVVLYKDDSDIIICEDSKEANTIYSILSKQLSAYKVARPGNDNERGN